MYVSIIGVDFFTCNRGDNHQSQRVGISHNQDDHLSRPHHFFDGISKQVFEGMFGVISCFNIVFLKQLMNDLSLSICYNNFVNRFLFSFCHH